MNSIVKTVPCVNVSTARAKTTQWFGEIPVTLDAAPGEVVNVPEAWAKKRHFGNRFHPSVIEMTIPQLVPCDSPEGQAFLAAQTAPSVPAEPTKAPKATKPAKPQEDAPKAPQGSFGEG